MYFILQPDTCCQPQSDLFDHRSYRNLLRKLNILVRSDRHEFIFVEYRCYDQVHHLEYGRHLLRYHH